MSSLHMNVHWPAIQARLDKSSELTDIVGGTCYSPKERTVSFLIRAFANLIDELFIGIMKNKEVMNQSSNEKLVVMIDNIKRRITQILQPAENEYTGYISRPGEPQILLTEVQLIANANVDFQEALRCVKQVKKIAFNFFDQLNVDGLAIPFDKDKRKHWESKLKLDLFNACYKDVGMLVSDKPISFSKEELSVFGIKEGEQIIDPAKIHCAAFAFLRIQELRAKEIIFYSRDFDLEKLHDQLRKWEYRAVTTPNENDLVVYFFNKVPAHVGIFTSSGLVESKLGSISPFSHKHRVFDVPNFGRHVVFFRKSVSKLW